MPLRAYGFTDDKWATPEAIALLMSFFVNARQETRTVDPTSVGAKQIGHLGFFRPSFRDTLWRDATDWLERAASTEGRGSQA